MSNGAKLNVSACGVMSNSVSGADALYLTGGSTLNAKNVSVRSSTAPCGMSGAGNFSCNNSGSWLDITGSAVTNAAPGIDPYANVPIPTPGSCTTQSGNLTAWQPSRVILNPGTFCNGLTISSNLTNGVTLNPGVYILDNSSLSITGSTVTGTGVTIILTSSTGTQYGTATITNGANVNLTAPTGGTYSGLVILQSPNAPAGGVNNIAGGANYSVTGALVFPSDCQLLQRDDNNSSCTQLIAWQLQFTGGATFGNNCAGTGTLGIGAGPSGVFLVR